jgi:hypothetical protein
MATTKRDRLQSVSALASARFLFQATRDCGLNGRYGF